MSPRTRHRNIIRTHTDTKLLWRLRLFLGIVVLMALIVGYDLYIGISRPLLLVPVILAGFGIGIVSSRILKLSWKKQDEKIIAQIDRFGIVVLAGYIAVELSREWILGHWAQGPLLSAMGFAFIGAAMAGRLYQLHVNIVKILTGEGKLS